MNPSEKCTRRGCTRNATTMHRLFVLPICRFHAGGTKRGMFSEKQQGGYVWAQVQDPNDHGSAMSGSTVSVGRRSRYHPSVYHDTAPESPSLTPDELLAKIWKRGIR